MTQKRITLGDNINLESGEKSIVINNTPDAIYVKRNDVVYFKKLSTVAPIFHGIEELYREATEEETERFINNDFIEMADGYTIDKIKKSNRKRIAMAIETLSHFNHKERKRILDYTHEYYPSVNSMEDVLRICRENIGDEFAFEIKDFLQKKEDDIEIERGFLLSDIEDLKNEKQDLEFENDELIERKTELEEIVDNLAQALDDAAYEVASSKNPKSYDVGDKKREYLKELFITHKIQMEYMPD